MRHWIAVAGVVLLCVLAAAAYTVAVVIEKPVLARVSPVAFTWAACVVGTVASLAVLDKFEPRTAATVAGFLAVYLLSFAGVVWRRLSGQYGFIAVEGPEGIRIRRGLLQTISETVPYGRIQAVRQVEPLLWRPFGWCRLEVDIAGATARPRNSPTTPSEPAALPWPCSASSRRSTIAGRRRWRSRSWWALASTPAWRE